MYVGCPGALRTEEWLKWGHTLREARKTEEGPTSALLDVQRVMLDRISARSPT